METGSRIEQISFFQTDSSLGQLPTKRDLSRERYGNIFKKALRAEFNDPAVDRKRIEMVMISLVNKELEEFNGLIGGRTSCEDRDKIEEAEAQKLSGMVQHSHSVIRRLARNVNTCLKVLQKHVLHKNHFTPHSKHLFNTLRAMSDACVCSEQNPSPLKNFLKCYNEGIDKAHEHLGKKIQKDLLGIFDPLHPKEAESAIKCLSYWSGHNFLDEVHKRDSEQLSWLRVNNVRYETQFDLKKFRKDSQINRSYFVPGGGSIFTDITVGKNIIGMFPDNQEDFYRVLFSKIYCEAHKTDAVKEQYINKEVQKFLAGKSCFCRDLLSFGSINCLLEIFEFLNSKWLFNDHFTSGTSPYTSRMRIYPKMVDGVMHFTLNIKRAFNVIGGHEVVGKLDLEMIFSTDTAEGSPLSENSPQVYCILRPAVTPTRRLPVEIEQKLKQSFNLREAKESCEGGKNF